MQCVLAQKQKKSKEKHKLLGKRKAKSDTLKQQLLVEVSNDEDFSSSV